jgi:hypothetical protein
MSDGGIKPQMAINGRGSLLVGPHVWPDGAEGTVVYAPPGVMLRTNVPAAPPRRDGWRIGLWRPSAAGRPLIDQDDPAEYVSVSLIDVTRELAASAPDRLAWVAEIVERQIGRLHGRMIALDFCGQLVFRDEASGVYQDYVGAIDEAKTAFAAAAAICGPGPDCLRRDHFRAVRQAVEARSAGVSVLPSMLRRSPPCR